MATGSYIGQSSSRRVSAVYVGASGLAKKVKRAYIGVGGVARLWLKPKIKLQFVTTYETNESYRQLCCENGGVANVGPYTIRNGQWMQAGAASTIYSKRIATTDTSLTSNFTQRNDLEYFKYGAAATINSYALFFAGESVYYDETLNRVDALNSSLTLISAPSRIVGTVNPRVCYNGQYALIGMGYMSSRISDQSTTVERYDNSLTKTLFPDTLSYGLALNTRTASGMAGQNGVFTAQHLIDTASKLAEDLSTVAYNISSGTKTLETNTSVSRCLGHSAGVEVGSKLAVISDNAYIFNESLTRVETGICSWYSEYYAFDELGTCPIDDIALVCCGMYSGGVVAFIHQIDGSGTTSDTGYNDTLIQISEPLCSRIGDYLTIGGSSSGFDSRRYSNTLVYINLYS